MQTKHFYPNLFNTTLLCTVVIPLSCAKKKDVEKPVKPNIVYILADDLGYGDLGCYGQQKFETPHIDRLAKDGMLFTQHYAGCTVSAPSRASLLTGKHTGHAYIRGNREILPEGQEPLPAEEITLFELLKKGGYVTGAFGKWGLGYPGSEGEPNAQGVDEFYGYNCQRLGHSYYPYHLWHNQEKVILKGNEGKQTNAYAPTLIHEQALQFLENNRDTTFFMYYPSIIPHAELAAPDSLIARFAGKYEPEKPYKGVDEGPGFRKAAYASQEKPRAAFAAMVALLDEQVGDIIAKLKELGIYENTLVVFTSDNGAHMEGGADPNYFNSSGDLRGYKRDLYEGGIHVPMIAAWKGKIEAGSISKHVSAFWDVLPTFCDLAGVEESADVDGISFLPSLVGGRQEEHPHLYWEFHGAGGRQAVRMGNWKAVRMNVNNNPEAPIELYDLEKDVSECQDVAGEYPEVVEKITAIMEKEHEQSTVFQFAYERKK